MENCTWMLMYSKIYYFLPANSTLDKKRVEEIACTCKQKVKMIMQHQHL